MKNQFKAAIFDLDGTLLDTLEDLAAAANRMLDSYGYPAHPIDSYRHFVGEGAARLVHRALPRKSISKAVEKECLASFLDDYRRHWRTRTCPYPGICDMLDALTARGMRMAVLSNKPHEITVQCVRHFLGKWSFQTVLGQRPQVPKKPDPAGALEIASLMNLSPSAFIYMGDTAIDMQTARGAGMFAVGVLWGFRPAEELQAGGADMLIDQPLDVMRLLD